MSNRVYGQTLRSALALTALLVGAGTLSGCSSMGGKLFGDPTITGSTSGASYDQGQSMPVMVSSSGNSSAPYIPPADIGASDSSRMQVASTGGQGNYNTISTQPLPPLANSSAVGSTNVMTAQPSLKPVDLASEQEDHLPVQPARTLNVVPDNPYLHAVSSGESMYTIARRYNVSSDEIVRANSLTSADKIFVGQKLVIPGKPEVLAAKEPTRVASLGKGQGNLISNAAASDQKIVQPVAEVAKLPAATAPTQVAAPEDKGFKWPLTGRLLVDFAGSKGVGINIEAAEGAPIKSAAAGSVIYVGSDVEGYGNLILIKHDNGYVSAYAHLKDTVVAKGDKVARGDTIGSAGMTGGVRSPQLHFELRQGAKPVDPTLLLG